MSTQQKTSRTAALHAGQPGFAEHYRAITTRDARFDGQFCMAVTSTGIYCRPSCPARTPKPGNVVFFTTSAAAHEAGFRACKRCLPEAAPGTPEWNLRRDAAGRAMTLIDDGLVDRQGVSGLAAALGYTPRHLGRLLEAELGAGPLALARAKRAQTARALLLETDLSVADIAHAAGFGSLRQCNDTVREVYGITPSQLRATRRRNQGTSDDADPPESATICLRLQLPLRTPYDAPGVFAFLSRRAVPGVETATQLPGGVLRCARTLHLPTGPGACEVDFTPSGDDGAWRASARIELSALADLPAAIARIRRIFDLDADPAAINAGLAGSPLTAEFIAARPGVRVPGAPDGTEVLMRAVVGQQIAVKRATGYLGEMTQRLGTPYSSRFTGLSRLFPTAGQLAEGIPAAAPGHPDPNRPLRLPARSINTVRTLTAAIASGRLRVDIGCDSAQLRAALTEYSGVGEWTADYVRMRLLHDPDIWLAGDMYLRGIDAADCAPWRAYAGMLLWLGAPTTTTSEPRTPTQETA